MDNKKVISLDEFKKKQKIKKNKKESFDAIEFAKRKLLEDNPNNIKYF